VARREGSLIVNSSQGGGSKDTWVVDGAIADPPMPRRASDIAEDLRECKPAEAAGMEMAQ
jgi:hypothetical protein